MSRRGAPGGRGKYAAKRERALALARKGEQTNLEIAAGLGVCRQTVDQWVRDAGLRPLGKAGVARRRKLNPTAADLERERERKRLNRERAEKERAWNAEREPLRQEAARRWRAGETKTTIGAALGVSAIKVDNLLAEHGIIHPRWRERRAQRDAERAAKRRKRRERYLRERQAKAKARRERRRAEGVRRGLAGERVVVIAADLGVSAAAIYKWLRAAGHPRWKAGRFVGIPVAVRKSEAVKRYAAGEPVMQIARATGLSSGRICDAVLEAGGKLRSGRRRRVSCKAAPSFRAGEAGENRAIKVRLPAEIATPVEGLAGSFGRSVEDQVAELLRAAVAPMLNAAAAEDSRSEDVTLRATDGVDLRQVAEGLERRGVPFRWLDDQTLAWREAA